jgi:hypothetical protein
VPINFLISSARLAESRKSQMVLSVLKPNSVSSILRAEFRLPLW